MSTPHGSDSHVDKWLRRAGDGAAEVVTASCLDAETAAAWLDGGLTDHALARAQAHAANCARCQALLRTLSDAELAADARATTTTSPAGRPWWTAWRAWLIPVGAAATLAFAVMVWTRTPAPRATRVPTDAPTDAGATATVERTPMESADSNALADSRDLVSSPATAPTGPPESQTPSAEAREVAPPTARAHERTRVAAAPLPTTASAEAVADAVSAQMAKAAAPSAGLNAAPSAAAPVPSAAAVAAPRAMVLGSVAEQVPAIELGPAGQSARWRLVAGRLEQRTARNEWAAVPGFDGPWTAGAAASDTECWVVGPAGSVARTVDGTTWTRVSFPRADALVSVRTGGASQAVVTTASGVSLSTADAGATWR